MSLVDSESVRMGRIITIRYLTLFYQGVQMCK